MIWKISCLYNVITLLWWLNKGIWCRDKFHRVETQVSLVHTIWHHFAWSRCHFVLSKRHRHKLVKALSFTISFLSLRVRHCNLLCCFSFCMALVEISSFILFRCRLFFPFFCWYIHSSLALETSSFRGAAFRGAFERLT